mgnify:CR=1 FL=1
MTDRHAVDDQRTARRASIGNLLARAERIALSPADAALLREHVNAEIDDATRGEATLARIQALADRIQAGAPWTRNHHDLAHRIRAALDDPSTPTATDAEPTDRALLEAAITELGETNTQLAQQAEQAAVTLARVRTVAATQSFMAGPNAVDVVRVTDIRTALNAAPAPDTRLADLHTLCTRAAEHGYSLNPNRLLEIIGQGAQPKEQP